ncbi:MAG: hypothetical protein KDA85_08065 [Planctomycetaceae bacterium]|nr:hypothetical protein [Planctomycetaceae bacterium]
MTVLRVYLVCCLLAALAPGLHAQNVKPEPSADPPTAKPGRADRPAADKAATESKSPDKSASARTTATRNTAANTTEMPSAERVIAFAAENHEELATLLRQLQKARSPEFDRAIREIAVQVQRLERMRERSPGRYESELTFWKLDSQIRLLSARWSMTQDPQLKEQILSLLRERRERRLALLEQERDRVTERLSQLDEQITAGRAAFDQEVDNEWDRLSKRVAPPTRSTPSTTKRTVRSGADESK